MARSYVYLFLNPSSKFTKIGKTDNPRARFSSIRTASPCLKVKLIMQFDSSQNSLNAEKRLHTEYHHRRYQLEWFRLNESCILDIKELAPKLEGFIGYYNIAPSDDLAGMNKYDAKMIRKNRERFRTGI